MSKPFKCKVCDQPKALHEIYHVIQVCLDCIKIAEKVDEVITKSRKKNLGKED